MWVNVTIAAILLCGQALLAQDRVTFEVASVKANKAATASGGMRTTQDRLTATANPAFDLIRFAYQMEDVRILGAPAWTNTERFDVSATIPASARAQVRAMMQSLLVDRFALKAHKETRPTRVNVLSVARTDGRLGSGLRAVERGLCECALLRA